MDAGVYFNSLGAPLLVSLDNQTSDMKKVFQNFNNNVYFNALWYDLHFLPSLLRWPHYDELDVKTARARLHARGYQN